MNKHAGVTYVELLIGIIVVSISYVGILKTLEVTSRAVTNPLQETQALNIADSYLEEILSRAYLDPSTGTVCPSPPASRSWYDNVCDYNGLSDTGAYDQNGNIIAGLEAYNVSVSVSTGIEQRREILSTANLENTDDVGLEVNVTVAMPDGRDITLTGYKANP